MELRIEDCNDDAFRAMAPKVRQEDQDEWRFSAGDTPAGLYASGSYHLPTGAGSLSRIAFRTDGAPLAAWGVSPAYDNPYSYYHKRIGWVWLVATPEAVPLALSLHRNLKAEFGRIREMYPTLTTASWHRNPAHHEWLRWLGFTQHERKFVTPYGGVFVPFYLKE